MAANRTGRNAVPLSDLAVGILEPVLRKRAGISIDLVQSWEEIVGDRLSRQTRPERIVWPKRSGEEDPFEPASLVVACEGAAALRLQHETSEIIGRVNAFLGFVAIGRIRIVQKPVDTGRKRAVSATRPLSEPEKRHLSAITTEIEDDALRESLKKLGASVLGAKSR